MKKIKLDLLKRYIDSKFNKRIDVYKNKITNIIDTYDNSGYIFLQNASYYGSQIADRNYTNSVKINLVKLDNNDLEKAKSLAACINNILKDVKVTQWYLAKLSRAEYIGDVYHALPAEYHHLIGPDSKHHTHKVDLRDESAYEILEQLDLQLYLEQ